MDFHTTSDSYLRTKFEDSDDYDKEEKDVCLRISELIDLRIELEELLSKGQYSHHIGSWWIESIPNELRNIEEDLLRLGW